MLPGRFAISVRDALFPQTMPRCLQRLLGYRRGPFDRVVELSAIAAVVRFRCLFEG